MYKNIKITASTKVSKITIWDICGYWVFSQRSWYCKNIPKKYFTMEVNKHAVSGWSFFKYKSQNKHFLFRDLDSLEKVCDILKNQVQKI